jgi:hypothetical protein
MKMRNWINHHSVPVTCGSIAMLVGALCYLNTAMNPAVFKPPTMAYYYDTVNNELFTGKMEDVAPIPTPAGNRIDDRPAGVRAYVFTCTTCSDSQARYIGYLETFTDEAREAQIKMNQACHQIPAPRDARANDQAVQPLEPPSAEMMLAYNQGHLMAAPSNPNVWHTEGSEAATALITKVLDKCASGEYPRQCLPDEP